MTSNQNAPSESASSLTSKDFLGRELNVGDKVVYAIANMEGTADLTSAWVLNLRPVTSNMYGASQEYMVADLTSESKDSTKIDYYCAASELILVESAE